MGTETRRHWMFKNWVWGIAIGAMASALSGSVHASPDFDDDFEEAEVEVVRMEATDSVERYCVESVCVGMHVQAVAGPFKNESGAVVGIDEANATVTVVNAQGNYLYPLVSELVAQNDLSWDGCYGPVCVGDKVKLKSGRYKRKKGFVVGIDVSNATAIVYVKRKKAHVSISIEDLKVKRREVYPEPYPVRYSYHHYSACDPWSVFDVYRGCVRVYHGVWHYHPVPPRVVVVRRVYAPRYRPVVVRRPNRVVVRDDTYPTPRTNPRGPRTSTSPSRGQPQRSGEVTTPRSPRSSTGSSRGTVTTPRTPSRSTPTTSRPSSGNRSGGVSTPSRSTPGSSRGTVTSPSRSSSGRSGSVSSPSRSSGSSSRSSAPRSSSSGSSRGSSGSSRGPR